MKQHIIFQAFKALNHHRSITCFSML